MPTWLDEWTVLYVVFLTLGYIAIFAFLDRHNRRKNQRNSLDSADDHQELTTDSSHRAN